MSNKVTIESLARMINKGFTEAQKDRELIKIDVSDLKKRVANIEETMVTKEFLTDKVLELKKDIIIKLKKQDARFDLLVAILLERKAIRKEDAEKITELSISAVF